MIKEKKNDNLKTETVERPPVVVVLGHVDHGKSSILQAIKDFKILEKESGGITQHIGAYEIEHQDKKITFIDTPGHEVFSAMRSRGAKVADIAILVIAAEEGIKPQTKEAISHIKKAGIPMIVAINKIDKPEANPEKVKRELAENDTLVESMGGKIPSVETSAKTKKGISELLELILLVAEMEGLKADREKLGEGVVIESYLDSKRGPCATLVLKNGILKKNDIIATPSTLGRVKILEDFQGKPILKAFLSQPIIVLGFEKTPEIGEKFKVFEDINLAKSFLKLKKISHRPAEVFFIEEGKKVLNLILKADVLGSLEAIDGILRNFSREKVILRIIKAEVGQVNESDIKLAKSAKAKILAFRVKTDKIAQSLAEKEKIKIMNFDVIYELTEDLSKLMEKLVKPKEIRVDFGKVKALIIFKTEKNRQIVGGKVIEGEVKKGTLIDVNRNDENVGKGKLINLQRNKKDIKRAIKGDECGILYEGDARIEQGDILQIYTKEKQKA